MQEKQIYYKVCSVDDNKLYSAYVIVEDFKREYKIGMNYAKKVLAKKGLGLAVFETLDQAYDFKRWHVAGKGKVFKCYGYGELKVQQNCCGLYTLGCLKDYFFGLAKRKPIGFSTSVSSWPHGTHLFTSIRLIEEV